MKTVKKTSNEQWEKPFDALAAESGVAVVIVDRAISAVYQANNNSMCRLLYSSEQFAPECDKYCGAVFQMVERAGDSADYQCYAGLECRAVPIKKEGDVEFVSIVGRTFTKAENYRRATERAISGDWQQFPPTQFFENVLLTSSRSTIETAAGKAEKIAEQAAESGRFEQVDDKQHANLKSDQSNTRLKKNETERNAAPPNTAAQADSISRELPAERLPERGEAAVWRSLFSSLLKLNYRKAAISILEFASKRFSIGSLAWVERKGDEFTVTQALGALADESRQPRFTISEEQLRRAFGDEGFVECGGTADLKACKLFPVTVGGETRSGLLIEDEINDEQIERHIAKFCHTIASEVEILRLREEVARNGWLEKAVKKFNESLSLIDSEDFFSGLTQISAELMRAERSSLLLFDEKNNQLITKAATGARADFIKQETRSLGERVALPIFHDGEPVVVPNINKIGLKKAPLEWNYKTDSFISYPIKIGERRIGVFNFSDRVDSDVYSENDLELLRAIMPQLAVLIDRAALKHKAGEYEQLSLTDSLTGLLNRRYLEERLTEEIKRSNRHGFPMSFMMIDVDDFKSYNDNFSHPEGDKALQLVGHCLKETLRGADVAARYGGEEFSILLPQTTSHEAEIIAERIREKVETTTFPNRQVTISVGIASCSRVICTTAEIIAAADKALYAAKHHGRNNVQVYEKL